jgi:hypothetical protein
MKKLAKFILQRALGITFVFVLIFSFSADAQDWEYKAPEYRKIKKAIQKEGTRFYYPVLMRRYLAADSTLSKEEKRHLYYGFVFQPEYRPYMRSDSMDSIRQILEREEIPSAKELALIVQHADAILMEQPFDLNALNYQILALDQLGYVSEIKEKVTKYLTIIDAIVSSGNGLTKNSAFYVIDTSHEYALLDLLGFQFGGSQTLIDHFDYLTLRENDAGLEGLYFDVSPCLDALSDLMGK